VHGDAGLVAARQATDIFFGAEITRLTDAELGQIFADVLSKQLPASALQAGLPIVDALFEAGLASSKGEARRTVSQGGAYVNNRRVEAADAVLTPANLASETVIVLRSGKKKYALLRFA
jgi:tyrosyl-tRNA synthetase